MRTLLIILMAVPLTGCTVFHTVDTPWPVIPEPRRPDLQVNSIDFKSVPPTEREKVLIRDIYAATTYANQLEAGVVQYNSAAKLHNEKVVADIRRMERVPQIKPAEITTE